MWIRWPGTISRGVNSWQYTVSSIQWVVDNIQLVVGNLQWSSWQIYSVSSWQFTVSVINNFDVDQMATIQWSSNTNTNSQNKFSWCK